MADNGVIRLEYLLIVRAYVWCGVGEEGDAYV